MDLDLWDYLEGKTCIITPFHKTHLVIYSSHSREGENLSNSQINTVFDDSCFIIFFIFQKQTHILTPYLNHLTRTDLMMGPSIQVV